MSSSSQYSLSFLILLISILQLVPQNLSTSRHVLDHHKPKTGFRVTLEHVDSANNFTEFERLQRAMVRGRDRLQKLGLMHLEASSGVEDSMKIESPVQAGSNEFLMQLAIGTPPTPFSAIMDTGSDLIWTQCQPCTNCFPQSTPVFDPLNSSSFTQLPCNNFCQTTRFTSCNNNNECQYDYTYGDSSSTKGKLGLETLTFGETSVNNIAFGCGLENTGIGFQGAGLVGLGRGQLSLVSQLDQPRFSYCLTSLGDKTPSTLIMGSLATINNPVMTTPLIRNPNRPTFYYVSLLGITIGDTRIPITTSAPGIGIDGTGGLIIDSGTAITHLGKSVFDIVKKEFIPRMKFPVDESGSSGLELCFKVAEDVKTIEVPKITFNFEGGDLLLPTENYMLRDANMGVACLVMGSSTEHFIFGNYQQQNMLVLHDLEKDVISFAPQQCNKL